MSPLQAMARRLFWWETPARDLADLPRLLAQVMVYGTADDVILARQHFPAEAFCAVLAAPPPGLFDPRSWAYWHAVFGVEAPPLPHRELPERPCESEPPALAEDSSSPH